MRSVVIVGAGLAGVRCAETLRAEGFAGRIVILGEEPHPPYERPALSKKLLAGTRDDVALRPESHWDELGLELVLGARVHRVRGGVAVADRRGWRYDRLVLATGARARRLPGPAPATVHHLRTLDDARRLRERLRPGRRLVVVGSGFVGGEVATTAAGLGVDVTVLDAMSSPLGGLLGPDVGSLVEACYETSGIELRLGAQVRRIEARAVVLADGERLASDLVLVAIGVEPAADLESAEAVLAGDVTGSGHWTAAAEQGTAAARRLLGLPALRPQPAFVWSDQVGLRLQVIGETRGAARVATEGDPTSFAAHYFDSRSTLVGAVVANRPTAVTALRREVSALQSAA